MSDAPKTEAPKRHFHLTRAALTGLKAILRGTEWFKGDSLAVQHSFRAGDILDNVLPALEDFKFKTELNQKGEKIPAEGEDDRAAAWEKEMTEPFDVIERHYETIKKAVEWAVKNGLLPNGRDKNLLMRQAGLDPDAG